MSEDQFTSIQWDRDEDAFNQTSDHHNNPAPPVYTAIDEVDEDRAGNDSTPTDPPSSLILSGKQEDDDNVDNVDDAEPKNGVFGANDDVATKLDAQVEHIQDLHIEDKVPKHDKDAFISSVSDFKPTGGADVVNENQPEEEIQKNTDVVGSPVAAEGVNIVSTPAQPIPQARANIVESFDTVKATVSDPQRETDLASKPYISYLLTTHTNSESIAKLSKITESKSEYTVQIRRRYGDFKFLYDCLINDYPQFLIPPLPSKLNFKYLTGDTFSSEFVHKRLHSLDRFVRFILEHKYLSQLKIFHLFISDSSDWTTFQKNLRISKGVSGDEEILSNFPLKVVNEELLTETIMNFFTPSKHKREDNKDIIEISDKLKKLYENLINLDRIFAKLNKKNYDLSFDYEQFLNQITKLSLQSSQDQDDDKIVSNNFKTFANSLSYFSENWSNLHKYIDETYIVTLRDCAKYIISLNNLIELQHNKKIDLQVLQDYLAKSRIELANLGGSSHVGSVSAPNPVISSGGAGGMVNNTTQLIRDTISTGASGSIGSSHTEAKKFKLVKKIEQLENEIQTQQSIVNDLTSRIINDEYPFWDKFNKIELKDSLLGLCDEQIRFYSGLVDKWNDAEITLMNRLRELG